MRAYRELQRLSGQISDPQLAWSALRQVRGSQVADVACGSGAYGYLLRCGWVQTESYLIQGIDAPDTLIGLDATDAALALAKRHRIFDELSVCSLPSVPLPDDAVDTVYCLEVLEHLYPHQVAETVAELARVARERIIISTPVATHLLDLDDVAEEREQAAIDSDPLPLNEYAVLAAALHTCLLPPDAMRAAGFKVVSEVIAGSLVYVSAPNSIRVQALKNLPGVTAKLDAPQGFDYRATYLTLLDHVLDFGNRLDSRIDLRVVD
ncbi:class I SAM-dependent methyltransferase [Rhodococcus sp. 06-235-1A]|uniref:class I SAM-dependent methyltransferase n=1 Tax=Rhodococcus sp. 06-235-1A TaxID=2022508 RepID=UPI0015C58E4D|nr:class I SAM-dependent methyltransferase [Rhodococcus sp. 06-235-1A]